jgi:hypothetical protein
MAFLKFLLARNWADIQYSPEAVQEQIKHYGEGSMEAKWLEEHAGKGVQERKYGSTSEPDTNEAVESRANKLCNQDLKQGYTPEKFQERFRDVHW